MNTGLVHARAQVPSKVNVRKRRNERERGRHNLRSQNCSLLAIGTFLNTIYEVFVYKYYDFLISFLTIFCALDFCTIFSFTKLASIFYGCSAYNQRTERSFLYALSLKGRVAGSTRGVVLWVIIVRNNKSSHKRQNKLSLFFFSQYYVSLATLIINHSRHVLKNAKLTKRPWLCHEQLPGCDSKNVLKTWKKLLWRRSYIGG